MEKIRKGRVGEGKKEEGEPKRVMQRGNEMRKKERRESRISKSELNSMPKLTLRIGR